MPGLDLANGRRLWPDLLELEQILNGHTPSRRGRRSPSIRTWGKSFERLRGTPEVCHRGMVYTRNGAIRGARLFRQVLSADVFPLVFHKRDTGIASLL